jgi:hypothetical protein
MQILEAALAFAITMLVLSLICSSFVEIIHRIGKMREAGLKYLLGQMFDQVIAKYLKAEDLTKLPGFASLPNEVKTDTTQLLQTARDSFVKRMSANRAPMGVTPDATPTPSSLPQPQPSRVSLLGGRELTSLTPAEFMERLGSMDVGQLIKKANDDANGAGAAAADAVDAILKDVAQKFEAFGKEAGTYFEGRARLLSVCVAIVFAFAIRVDAIELFNTYLRDPNARNKVIEQTQAVTAQHKAATEAAEALQKASGGTPNPDVKKQVDAIQKEWKAAIDNTRSTVKQYSDLGLPIGWTKENASLNPWAPTCGKEDGTFRVIKKGETCKEGEKPDVVGCWNMIALAASLLLGGILIGLGGPFWYDTVMGLSNIRNIARELTGGSTKGDSKAPAGVAPPAVTAGAAAPVAVPTNPDRPQPETPVGAFTISRAAAKP